MIRIEYGVIEMVEELWSDTEAVWAQSAIRRSSLSRVSNLGRRLWEKLADSKEVYTL